MCTKTIALFAALMLMSSAPGVLADEEDTATVPLTKSSAMKAELLADFSETATTSVVDLRTSGIGWGALFKIYKLAAAMGVDASSLVGAIGPDGEFAFGELKKALTDEQRAAFDALPKNFGTLVASAVKAPKALEKAAEREERKAARNAERDARKDARDAAKAERDAGNDTSDAGDGDDDSDANEDDADD